MALLKVIEVPDPRLRKKSTPVDAVDDVVRTLLDDMLETMYAADGIGLAAPQVGINKRIIVIDISPRNPDGEGEPMFFINPEITWESEAENTYKEGCLSLPEQFADVVRPKEVTIKYTDRNGEVKELHADKLLSTVIQHEIDHLEGVLFVDYVSRLKRNVLLKKLRKLQKEKQEKKEEKSDS